MNELSSLLDRYKSIVVFDTETTGLNFSTDQIIELAAVKIIKNERGKVVIDSEMDEFISLPEGQKLDPFVVNLTGITDEMLLEKGISYKEAAKLFYDMSCDGPTLLVAHNAQFDLMFTRNLLRGCKYSCCLDFLDTLTVYKDRRPYPHKLKDAITAYGLDGKVQNSHRAIDDVKALVEVLMAMDSERPDLEQYINLFGFNPKYGISGEKIRGVRYVPQSYHDKKTLVEETLYSYLRKVPSAAV
ncbi:MAG: 3'-5' exonuclease [Oscillospiraceae bacterium]|nr:3'-5' exonuclease [Oscillospiraceae bacterium]